MEIDPSGAKESDIDLHYLALTCAMQGERALLEGRRSAFGWDIPHTTVCGGFMGGTRSGKMHDLVSRSRNIVDRQM
jgi:hypothetical protein